MKRTFAIYTSIFFFSLHYATVLYINSSYLENYFNLGAVCFLYTLGALGNIWLFYKTPALLKQFGNRALFIIFILIEALATGGLVFAKSPLLIAFLFVLYGSVPIIIGYSLDLFLEEISLESTTGSSRGWSLTASNLAVLFAPLLIAYFASDYNFAPLYALATIFLLPVLYTGIFSFRRYKDGRSRTAGDALPWAAWRKAKNLRNISIARFCLEFFYVFMIIFTPIYLNKIVGFNWQEIGFIFVVMLLPFVIIQVPAGKIADKWLGEKEMLIFGFFISGVSLLFMPFIGKDLFAWATVLFASRVGASLVEEMCESYFFKHVDNRDSSLISIFRLARPLAFTTGSVFGLLSIELLPFYTIFPILAWIMFWGMRTSARIKDTL